MILRVLILFFSFSILSAQAQAIRAYCLEVTCKPRYYTSTQTILDFKWRDRAPSATNQYVYKRDKSTTSYSGLYMSIPSSDTTFSDTVPTGKQYEYRFEKEFGPHGYSVFGYVLAGHRVPAVFNRGKVLVIIDSTNKAYLDTVVRTLRNDLIGDGWTPVLKYFSPSTTVTQIKSYILTTYRADPNNVRSVLLIGNLAVPYSGDFKASGEYPPDGHTSGNSPGASHEGAWPADCFYGDVLTDSLWTDSYVTNSLGARAANNNSPGDGKYDNTFVPYLINLQVGRIDLSDMSAFSLTERELIRQYLMRNHDYRHKVFSVKERCLLDDIFGTGLSPEDLANNAYRNMAPLIGDTATKALNYLTTLNSNDYLWSFGFGYGDYNYNSAIGYTSDFASSSQTVKTVFSGFFGSYFGDWDNSNNFLRAPLAAKGYVLNTFYSGRPHWYFHHMSLGETIGYSTMMTQNNYDTANYYELYPNVQAGLWNIHPALMGDPTIRMQPVEPARNFYVVQDSCSNRFRLRWQAPTDTAVHDYYIFRAKHIDSGFTMLGNTQNLTYVDNSPLTGINVYMLRDMKLQTSYSGTYFNLGQGVFDTVSTTSFSTPIANAGRDTIVCSGQYVKLGMKSINNIHTTYSWSPATFNRDTTTVRITTSGNRILIATDTLTKCSIRDTAAITAQAIPVAETLFRSSTSSCGDTTNWSSSANNGNAYNYNWTFGGGSPSSASGRGLNTPATVNYYTTGTYLTSLTVADTLIGCSHTDTASINVICVPLPIDKVIFSCESDLKGQSNIIRFMNMGNTQYREYIIKGISKSGNAVVLYKIEGNDFNVYEWLIDNRYEAIELTAIRNDGSLENPEYCHTALNVSKVNLYPVPAANRLTMEYNEKYIRDFEYTVYNNTGAQIQIPALHSGSGKMDFDTEGLPDGQYILVIYDNGICLPLRFIISR